MACASRRISSRRSAGASTSAPAPQRRIHCRISSVPATSASKRTEPSAWAVTRWLACQTFSRMYPATPAANRTVTRVRGPWKMPKLAEKNSSMAVRSGGSKASSVTSIARTRSSAKTRMSSRSPHRPTR